ncbi:MAG: SDR family oxidoreductase [Phaeodactylibacter sp.]|nr:SDR family oxidoreductase [Phaeodactylibacter sp.]
MDLKNKNVWITGASSGIGEALAYAFAREGANLILSSRKRESLEAVRQNCPDNVKVLIQPLDVADFEAIPAALETVRQEIGSVDILINNAGVSQRSLAKDTPLAVDQRIMNINFFGAVAMTKAVLPDMLKRQSGHIITISSLSGKFGVPLRTAYGASKHALHGFFDGLREELYEDQIKVLLVCPGYIRTNISVNALMADGSSQGKMDFAQDNGMSPDELAKRILKALHQNKQELYVGGREVMGIYLKRFAPRLLSKAVRKNVARNKEKTGN